MPPTVNEVLGNNLVYLRERAGLSQEELAFRAGISRSHLSAVERAKRDCGVAVLGALATALNVLPGVLLDEMMKD